MSQLEQLKNGIMTGFIDRTASSLEEYQPKLLVNDYGAGKKVLTSIIGELTKCEEFFFSVAFVTNSGVATLINTLQELEAAGIHGKIIASQYQNFTEPRALTRLSKLNNIDLRIVTEKNLHTKGYIFKRKSSYSLIVGSSNLTGNALSYNQEWNLKVSSSLDGGIITNVLSEFGRLFSGATPVNDQWIEEYCKIYSDPFIQKGKLNYGNSNENDNVSSDLETGAALPKAYNYGAENGLTNAKNRKDVFLMDQTHREELQTGKNDNDPVKFLSVISPNKMQVNALQSLERLREDGKDKALLISATGTGKTYLSAFDAKKFEPKRFLFVVHRENIARAAMETFRRVFGNSKSMGLLSGNSKEYETEFIFSTMQTMSKLEILSKFHKETFDYIVIDEAHHLGAESYKRIIEYFKPLFLLGMSATPERTDQYDIFKQFDHNIAYEIRLHTALEENMLSPFHYYGISDIMVDGQLVDDDTGFNDLVSSERVNQIIHYANFYNCDHGRVKGLIFCSRKLEAQQISKELNLNGYRTIALDGESSESLREQSINRLESDEADHLDYIFTVDIFNEGVDIPSVNQIIMLRPTQSAIVFVQQLGRGLRKTAGKEYLTVIDFIGNYSNNYLVPIALYGDNSYNKDTIRRLVTSSSSFLPGASTVNFDFIAKQRIFDAIDAAKVNSYKDLKNDYKLLKYKVGHIPSMMDFVQYGSRDPYAYVVKDGSYYAFVAKQENDLSQQLSRSYEKLLEFFAKEVCNGKRIDDIVLLKMLVERASVNIQAFKAYLSSNYQIFQSSDTYKSVLANLNGQFMKLQDRKKYGIEEILLQQNDEIVKTPWFSQIVSDVVFKHALLDVIDYAIDKYRKMHVQSTYSNGFLLYQKYSRKDVCRILNWKNDESSTVYGYRIKYDTCPIFVTYSKTDTISSSINYEDYFINNTQLNWMTRNGIRMESNETRQLMNYNNGLRILLFIKKSDAESTDFYYMGDMKPFEFSETTIKNDAGRTLPIVNVKFNMEIPVEDNLYNYLHQ